MHRRRPAPWWNRKLILPHVSTPTPKTPSPTDRSRSSTKSSPPSGSYARKAVTAPCNWISIIDTHVQRAHMQAPCRLVASSGRFRPRRRGRRRMRSAENPTQPNRINVAPPQDRWCAIVAAQTDRPRTLRCRIKSSHVGGEPPSKAMRLSGHLRFTSKGPPTGAAPCMMHIPDPDGRVLKSACSPPAIPHRRTCLCFRPAGHCRRSSPTYASTGSCCGQVPPLPRRDSRC